MFAIAITDKNHDCALLIETTDYGIFFFLLTFKSNVLWVAKLKNQIKKYLGCFAINFKDQNICIILLIILCRTILLSYIIRVVSGLSIILSIVPILRVAFSRLYQELVLRNVKNFKIYKQQHQACLPDLYIIK